MVGCGGSELGKYGGDLVKEFGIFIYLPHYLNQNWEGVAGGGGRA